MNTLAQRIKEFNHVYPEDLLAIKYKRMAENCFSFYRGTCHLFYEDLCKEDSFPPSPTSWISGDLHLENFGTYKGDNRLVYFDLNDFNEAVLSPVTWEIARMISSVFIAFHTLKIRQSEAVLMAGLFLNKYAAVLRGGKALYIEKQVASGIVRTFLETVCNRDQKELLHDRTVKNGKDLCFRIDKERHIALNDHDLKKELHGYIQEFMKGKHREYSCSDVAFRIAGTGSIGIKRYVFLLKHLRKSKKYLLIDMKEATPSAVAKYSVVKQPEWTSEAERMFTIQCYMQNNTPALSSTGTFRGSSFIIQEMQPTADKIDFKLLKKGNNDISQVISDMAVLTASAQIRSTGRRGSAITDELVAFGNDDQWQKKIIDFSVKYSEIMNNYYVEYFKEYNKGGYG